MNNPFDLTGKVALVTGAGRGIGREIARTLAGAGADLVIGDIHLDTASDAASEIRESTGRLATYGELDVREPNSVEALVLHALETFGKIDILVNNAGIAVHVRAEEMTDAAWKNVMDVNLNGVYWCSREVGKHMLERGSGAIVNIASMSGIIVNTPQPQAAYNVSKAGVIMMTKSLAVEWAERGVRVNSVSPGYIGTDMVHDALKKLPEWESVWMAMTPMKRLGKPSEVANAVWYLASDASGYATGTNLVVDGGYTSL